MGRRVGIQAAMMMTFISILRVRLSADILVGNIVLSLSVMAYPFHISSSIVCPSRVSGLSVLWEVTGSGLQVMSVFALTVIGTFEVLIAAHIPALLKAPLASVIKDQKVEDSQHAHTQQKRQQKLFPHGQLELPHDVNRNESKGEVQKGPVTLESFMLASNVRRHIPTY